MALHEDVPQVTNKFHFIYTDLSIPISIHDVCETGGRIRGTCFLSIKTKKELHKNYITGRFVSRYDHFKQLKILVRMTVTCSTV